MLGESGSKSFSIRPWLLLMACFAALLGTVGGPEAVVRSLAFKENFEHGDLRAWRFPFPEDWEIFSEGPNHFLHMKRNRQPGVPRRPLQFALLEKARVGSFELQTKIRREGRSMIIVFNYVDTLHFYYAHLSADRGTEQPVHNGLFIVNGEARRRIAGTDAPPALPDREWRQVRVVRDASSGLIEVFVDGGKDHVFSISDRTFTCGQIGVGSFDETGDFDDIAFKSKDAGCEPGAVVRPANGS